MPEPTSTNAPYAVSDHYAPLQEACLRILGREVIDLIEQEPELREAVNA